MLLLQILGALVLLVVLGLGAWTLVKFLVPAAKHYAGDEKEERRPPSGPEAGFTLIEVMIVLAIFMILAAVLIPALAPERSWAKRGSTEEGVRDDLAKCELDWMKTENRVGKRDFLDACMRVKGYSYERRDKDGPRQNSSF